MSGDDDLAGRIEVDGFDRAGGAARFTSSFHVFVGEADHGRHAAHAHGDGRLHGFGAEAHELHRLFEREDSCGAKGRVFAERMARKKFGLLAAGRQPGFIERDRGSEHRGLRVDREVEFFGRAFGDEAFDREAERFVGACEGAADRFIVGEAAEHPDGLTALTGEYESNAHLENPGNVHLR